MSTKIGANSITSETRRAAEGNLGAYELSCYICFAINRREYFMVEGNGTTQNGNMTINLFLWILSSSKNTRIQRVYHSAVLQVYPKTPAEKKTPRIPPGRRDGDTRPYPTPPRPATKLPGTRTGAALAQELPSDRCRGMFWLFMVPLAVPSHGLLICKT